MKRFTAILLIAWLVVGVSPAYAGGVQSEPTPPENGPTSMSNYPDIVGYIRIVIANPLADAVCEAEPTGGSWFDVSFQLSRLAWLIRQQFNQLVCVLVSLLQALANGLASGANAVLIGINQAWRFAIFTWLTIRAWLLAAWYLVELFRDSIHQVETWLFTLQLYVGVLVSLALTIIALVGQLVGQLVSIALELGNVIGWFGGLLLGFITAVLTALQGTSVPEQLESTHPIYQIVRGMGEGVLDSSVVWAVQLLWASAYVAFVYWLAKFLTAGDQP